MRDPKRIPTMLDLIEDCWKQHPDWRLGQVIVNLMKQTKPNIISPEVFYFEDSELLETLECLKKTLKE